MDCILIYDLTMQYTLKINIFYNKQIVNTIKNYLCRYGIVMIFVCNNELDLLK